MFLSGKTRLFNTQKCAQIATAHPEAHDLPAINTTKACIIGGGNPLVKSFGKHEPVSPQPYKKACIRIIENVRLPELRV
jgi:hypothetical protein